MNLNVARMFKINLYSTFSNIVMWNVQWRGNKWFEQHPNISNYLDS